MSKLTRTLVLGAALAAMNLAGMTAVAQAQANERRQASPAAGHRRPSGGDLAQAPGHTTTADRHRTPTSGGSGPRSDHPWRDTRPGARPDAG